MLGLMERGFGLGSHAALDGIVPDARVDDMLGKSQLLMCAGAHLKYF